MKRLIVDLDNTLTVEGTGDYETVEVREGFVQKLREYQAEGFEIVIFTARNMRTYAGNVGKINIHTLPGIIAWLERHGVPHDEIIVGKPWCGHEGFYLDDKAIRPDEFLRLSYEEVKALVGIDPAKESPGQRRDTPES